jgi:hypothetical protein
MLFLARRDAAVFIKIVENKGKGGTLRHYAYLVRNDRVKGKVIQTTLANLGFVEEGQIPYLKAAYAKDKPKLVYSDGTEYP